MARGTYSRHGHPFDSGDVDLSAEARAERKLLWPEVQRRKMTLLKKAKPIRSKPVRVKPEPKPKLTYTEKLDAAIARAKAGAK
jgi:hypothetical protein